MLPAEERLRRDRDFKRVYAAKRAIVHPLMVLYTRPSKLPGRRIGFSVSKKLGGAVKRNRVRRRLREACRSHGSVLKTGFDAIIVARSRIATASYTEIARAVVELFRRAGLAEKVRAERVELQPRQDGRDGRTEGIDPGVAGDGVPRNRDLDS